MAKVLGVGGIFFKSKDPKALMDWYQRALGIAGEAGYVAFLPSAVPPGGATVFSSFNENTEKFAPSTRDFMFNLMVDDMDGALRQVTEAGAQIVDERQDGEYGSFAWFMDPDGNKVELWQPKPMA